MTRITAWTRGAGLALASILLALIVSGCACLPRRHAVPEALSREAVVPGIPGARVWGDEEFRYVEDWLAEPGGELRNRYAGIVGKPHHYLALSGGGPYGAFGAGLLVGWTQRGDRPEFTMVTGISAGGLTAPFAFLGSEYDKVLRDVFTQPGELSIIRPSGFLRILRGDAVMDSASLQSLIERYVDQSVVDAIAAEHRKGRRLLIVTTNLDAARPVIWDIGAIAASEDPRALFLIHQILLATASIPAAFPPVLVEVEAEGERFDEMHVDGGTVSQIFVYPTGVDWKQVTEELDVRGKPSLYLIQNFHLNPQWQEVEPEIVSIAIRSMLSMIRSQGIGDLYRIYLLSQRDGLDFNLAHIPEDFRDKPKEIFDPEYMRKLFDRGYQLGLEGYPWEKAPPGIELDN